MRNPLIKIEDRIHLLKNLKESLKRSEKLIQSSLYADLNKGPVESYFELGPLLAEIDYTIQQLPKWVGRKRHTTPLFLFPGSTFVEHRPQGRVLILGAWNYPLLLTFGPMVNAISAGNFGVIKPSELAPATASLMQKIVTESLDGHYSCELGGREVAEKLLAEKWEHIFYTGGERVGKIIAERAAKDLTRFTLELGGKSPAVLDREIDLDMAARKIVFGKFSNCGQTCIAPDYVLVPRDRKQKFWEALQKQLKQQFGPHPLSEKDYGKIVNNAHWRRLQGAWNSTGQAAQPYGNASFDEQAQKIAPILVDGDALPPDHDLLRDEIFGPLLPILSYETEVDLAPKLQRLSPTPLTYYLFSNSEDFIAGASQLIQPGSVVINEVLGQLSNPDFPFGGNRSSGVGRYRGYAGFLCFSNSVSIFKGSGVFDPPIRYRPYTESKLTWIKRFLGQS